MNLRKLVLDYIFPPLCPFCHDVIEVDELFCPKCQSELPWNQQSDSCEWEIDKLHCIAPLWYRDSVLDGILRFKFHNCPQYAPAFGLLMAQAISDQHQFDIITWAPLSPKRLKSRGYNQAKLLADQLAIHLKLPLLDTLEKTTETPAQSSIDNDELRAENVRGVYRLKVASDEIRAKKLLFVDDVITTGATLRACVEILEAEGAEQVVCVALARSRK